jgi:peptidoglycan/LPS O-acetylase OafA/YrhL
LGEQWAIDAPCHLYEIGLTALIFATAALSYQFVEKPILRLKGRFRGGARAMPLAAAGVSQEAA